MDIATTIVVGLAQIAPNVCQVNLLHPDLTLYTYSTKCDMIIQKEIYYEPRKTRIASWSD
jgi:hypothetical protein